MNVSHPSGPVLAGVFQTSPCSGTSRHVRFTPLHLFVFLFLFEMPSKCFVLPWDATAGYDFRVCFLLSRQHIYQSPDDPCNKPRRREPGVINENSPVRFAFRDAEMISAGGSRLQDGAVVSGQGKAFGAPYCTRPAVGMRFGAA